MPRPRAILASRNPFCHAHDSVFDQRHNCPAIQCDLTSLEFCYAVLPIKYFGLSENNHRLIPFSLQQCLTQRSLFLLIWGDVPSPHPMHACRIGEAKNPGPDMPDDSDSDLVTFAITNPTAVHQKAADLALLKADCLILSETSATSLVQSAASSEFRAHGYKTIWGAPVPQQLKQGDPNSFRGAAIGVSFHSKLPIRPARSSLGSEWYDAGRFQHVFLRLPTLEIQICNLYGIPASVASAKARTNTLLQFAHQTVRQSTFPAMIVGDLNQHPDTLDEMTSLRSEGYRSMEELYRSLYGQELPPTFGDATRNDVCLIHPILAVMVHDIWIDQQQLVAGHNPLCFRLRVPTREITRQSWNLPTPWVHLQPKTALIGECYASVFDPTGATLLGDTRADEHPIQIWTNAVENAVHEALRKEHQADPLTQPWSSLPRRHRGRCKPRSLVRTPLPRSIKTACDGQYTPDVDQPTMHLRQITRQMRRIQSLKQRIRKIETVPPSSTTIEQLHQEWTCILQSTGYHHGFCHWMRQFPELLPIPYSVPSFEFLYLLEQLHRFHLDQVAYDHKVRLQKLQQYQQDLDSKRFGRSDAFRRIREPSGLVGVLSKEHRVPATMVSPPTYGLATFSLGHHMEFDFTQPVFINQHACTIVQTDGFQLEVMIHDEVGTFPDTVEVMQPRDTAEPKEVADQLSIYWRQFWNRDSSGSQHNLDHWEAFEALRRQIPPKQTLTVDVTSVELLQTAIAQMSSTTSRGCCGWSSDELKDLPVNCVRDLLHLFNLIQEEGFPDWMMQARVLPVAKHHKANMAKATRPITVLSLLYRLYSKWTSRQILQAWTCTLPESITGFLPGRSSHKLIYEMQLALEATNHGHSHLHWGGLTLDIIKAFNTLPHLPLCQLLIHFGVPPALVRAWISSIQKMIRYWQIDSQLFVVPAATTGVPEGDAWSVVAMLAVNIFMVTLMAPHAQRLNAFADNWSYSTTDPTQHQPAMATLTQIAEALSIGIDWGKTWAWGTSQPHQEALQAAKDSVLAPEVQLQLVTHARDLGYIMHYRLAPFRGTQKERHKQALARLHRLRKADISVQDKAYVAMASAVTKALYGTHMYLVGEEYFSQLRSKIATAMLGSHHNIQSHIACSCLSPTLVDPELWVIQNAIKEARLFLLQADPALVSLFLRMAAHHQVRYNLIVGPAMALSAYLAKLGWTIDQQGCIHCPNFNHLHLIHCNQEELMLATERAWMEHVSLCVSNRHHLRNLPRIDNRATVKVFQAVPPEKQRSVGLDLCMGYMVNEQKAHFDEFQDAHCQFCDQADTVMHRVLHCQATQVVRAKYPAVCDFLQDHDVIHTLLPAAYADPEVDFHSFVFEKYPEPQCQPLPYTPRFLFTDGSCKMPANPNHRWASYAVVATPYDLSQVPCERLNDASWLLQNTFDTVAVSHVTGLQTIPRAELMAATLAQEMQLQVPVVTDSQYVMYVHHLIEQTPYVWKLAKKKNFELLRRLHALHWDQHMDIPILKVKAHQKISREDPNAFMKLGNMVADYAATQTQEHLARHFTTNLARLAHESKQMKDMLCQHLTMRAELAELRKRLETETVQTETVEPKANFFKQYVVNNPVKYTFTLDQFEHVHASRFGSRYSALVLEWLQTLEWPTHPDRQKPPVGVTWLELACNFMITTQHSLKINVSPHGQPTKYSCMEEDITLDHTVHCFSLATNALRDCIAHLGFLLQTDLLPTLKPQKVTSLRKMGGNATKQGIAFRPVMKRQSETVDLLVAYFEQQQGSRNFTKWPNIPYSEPCVQTTVQGPNEDNQEDRNRRYNARRRDIRLSRQAT